MHARFEEFMKNLKKDIEQKQFHRVSLLHGPESYLRLHYRDLLVKAILPDEGNMNLNIMKADSITEKDIIDLDVLLAAEHCTEQARSPLHRIQITMRAEHILAAALKQNELMLCVVIDHNIFIVA